MSQDTTNITVCIVGLGYVGLPLAVACAKKYSTTGFDINQKRVDEINQNIDFTNEISTDILSSSTLTCSIDPTVLADANIIIVTVPTPIKENHDPDLTPLKSACITIGKQMQKGAIVIFESTVFPGATEEMCVPILEKNSKLVFGKEFYVGYSPERINPQDKEHTVENIAKVVSGSDTKTTETVRELYASIIKAPLHVAPSIKVAEAAKVIENIQRDLNIALVNELSIIFRKEGIKTQDVLAAAATKWNFHKYTPGLVGGHCIGVDPYYLAKRSLRLGHNPSMILGGRFVNEYMVTHVANIIEDGVKTQGDTLSGKNVLVLGVTYKANVNDLRNSKVKELILELKERGANVIVDDPLIEQETLKNFSNAKLQSETKQKRFDVIVFAVAHDMYLDKGHEWITELITGNRIIVDLSGKLSENEIITSKPNEKIFFNQL